MMIQAEVSLYPLKELDIATDINDFLNQLKSTGLDVEFGRMSSIVSGELPQVFDGLKEAFQKIADKKQSVLIIKVSNACPLPKQRRELNISPRQQERKL